MLQKLEPVQKAVCAKFMHDFQGRGAWQLAYRFSLWKVASNF
jgi:hypothetical protein